MKDSTLSSSSSQPSAASMRAWFIWGLCAILFFMQYFARVGPSVMIAQLEHAFHADTEAISQLGFYFYVTYVGMQLPVGALFDRFGVGRILIGMAALSALMSGLFAVSHSLLWLNLSRFFLGFAAAFSFVGALKLASAWFPGRFFSMLAGITQSLGMLGGAVTDGLLAWTATHFGWRETWWGICIGLSFLTLMMVFVVRDKSSSSKNKKRTRVAPPLSLWASLKMVLQNPQSWINALQLGLLFAPTVMFGELWGPHYLEVVHGVTPVIAGIANGMIFVGWALAGPIIGPLSERFKCRKPFIFISAVLSLVVLSLVLFITGLPAWLLCGLLFIYGVFNTGVVMGYVVSAEINAPEVSATSMAFANMVSIGVGALLIPLAGKLLESLSSASSLGTVAQFQIVFLLIPAAFILAFLMALKMKETYPKTSGLSMQEGI